MYCVKCGKVIADNSKFCPACGAAVQLVPTSPATGDSNPSQSHDSNVFSPQNESALDAAIQSPTSATLPVDPYARASSALARFNNPIADSSNSVPPTGVDFRGDPEAEYLAKEEGVPFEPNAREAARIAQAQNGNYPPPGGGYRGGFYRDSTQLIRDYFVLNLIATLCCCLPVGAIGTFFSWQTMTAKSRGDSDAAARYSERAACCFWIVVTFLACVSVVYFAEIALEAIVIGTNVA